MLSNGRVEKSPVILFVIDECYDTSSCLSAVRDRCHILRRKEPCGFLKSVGEVQMVCEYADERMSFDAVTEVDIEQGKVLLRE